LPDAVVTLAPGFVVTWPLLVGKTLLAALPFFAFALPLWVIAVPLWLGFSWQRNLSLASLVSSSETFWTERRTRRKQCVSQALWLLSGAAILGLAWPTLVPQGEVAALLGNAPITPDWALAALWTTFVIGAVLGAGALLEMPFSRAEQNLNLLPQEAVACTTAGNTHGLRGEVLLKMLHVFSMWTLLAYFVACSLAAAQRVGALRGRRVSCPHC
jgi:hypothetical protein